MSFNIIKISKLIGKASKEQLKHIDCFIGDFVGLFMPRTGACFQALTPRHTHPSYMFLLPFDDETKIKINEKIFKALPGKIFAVSPEISHHELPSDTPPRYIAIFVSSSFFKKQLVYYKVSKEISFLGETFNSSPELLGILTRFMIEADSRLAGRDIILNALSIEICHAIIRNFDCQPRICDRVSVRLEIDRTLEYMHSNINKKITILELANIAHMSTVHFYRVFKKEMNKTPIEYLSQIRLQRARRMLLSETKSITEIAFECGFSSSSYFSNCFKEYYKISPSKYINS